MARIIIYRKYDYIDKDPVIGQVKSMIEKEHLLKKPKIVEEISGVSRTTIYNWFHGETKRPQFSTVMAVASSLGYKFGFKQAEQIDVEVERKAAAKWRAQQERRQLDAKTRLIAQRKAAKQAASGHAGGAAFNKR